jgi:hypothetical protein
MFYFLHLKKNLLEIQNAIFMRNIDPNNGFQENATFGDNGRK